MVGRDQRGWNVVMVRPSSREPNAIYRIRIGGRVIEVPTPRDPMLIYVNPTRGGFDEWETPPGSGTRLMVGTPLGLEEVN